MNMYTVLALLFPLPFIFHTTSLGDVSTQLSSWGGGGLVFYTKLTEGVEAFPIQSEERSQSCVGYLKSPRPTKTLPARISSWSFLDSNVSDKPMSVRKLQNPKKYI